jgi:hypothetical protein
MIDESYRSLQVVELGGPLGPLCQLWFPPNFTFTAYIIGRLHISVAPSKCKLTKIAVILQKIHTTAGLKLSE